jgi:hypothetical protein
MLVARVLKIGKIADGGMPPTYETMHQHRERASLDDPQASCVFRSDHLKSTFRKF